MRKLLVSEKLAKIDEVFLKNVTKKKYATLCETCSCIVFCQYIDMCVNFCLDFIEEEIG